MYACMLSAKITHSKAFHSCKHCQWLRNHISIIQSTVTVDPFGQREMKNRDFKNSWKTLKSAQLTLWRREYTSRTLSLFSLLPISWVIHPINKGRYTCTRPRIRGIDNHGKKRFSHYSWWWRKDSADGWEQEKQRYTYSAHILSSFVHFIERNSFWRAKTVPQSLWPHSSSIVCVAFCCTNAKLPICVLLKSRRPPSSFHLPPGLRSLARSLMSVYGASRSILSARKK